MRLIVPLATGKGALLVDALLCLHWERVEEMVLHNQASFAQQSAIPQLDGQPVQTVSSQFQLCELKQLTHRLGEHSQRVVPQKQGLELGATEQSFGQHLQLVGVHGQVLEVV